MHIVAVHRWQKEEAEVAKIIAETMGSVVFEARQKISGGGPAVLASFADSDQADALTAKLSQNGIPALVIDTAVARSSNQPFHVRRFVLGPQAIQVESFDGESCDIDYSTIDLLLVATCSSGQMQTTTTETERKFSLGKTLLAGGVPMTKKVMREKIVNSEERDETLWLYAHEKAVVIFDRAVMNYDGLGEAMQLTRDLNFAHLKNELKRLAPQAGYDDRLIKRATLIRLLGSALNPEADLDLAFEVLARSLREQTDSDAC
jgi:hypothetical protein